MIIYLLTILNLFGFYFDLVVLNMFSDFAGWLFCASSSIFAVFSSSRDIRAMKNDSVDIGLSSSLYSLSFIATDNEILGSLSLLFTVTLLIRINMHNN